MADLTLSANADTLLGCANFAAMRTVLSLGNVENTAVSTWTGTANITTLGTIATGTWQGTIIAPAYLGTGASISTKYLRGDGTWQTLAGGGDAATSGTLDQFADVTQTAGQTLAISASTTLAGGTHSGNNTGDQTSVTGNAGTVTTINGRIVGGANVTLSGAGTAASPYSIAAGGGALVASKSKHSALQAVCSAKQASGNLRDAVATGTIVDNGAYNAFPSLCLDAAGAWRVVMRSGTDHQTSEDGQLVEYVSINNGASWATSVIDAGSGSIDVREGYVRLLGDGRLFYCWTTYVPGTTSWRLWIAFRSVGGVLTAPVEIVTTTFSDPFIGGPLVVTDDGAWLIPAYGLLGVETKFSAVLLRSTDQGTTWSEITVLTGVGVDYDEFRIVSYPGTNELVAFVRAENATLTRRVSNDGGLTWGSSTVVTPASYTASNPDVCVIGNATHLFYRAGTTTRRATSFDRGLTWSATEQVSALKYEYSDTCVLTNGLLLTAISLETSSTNSAVYFLTTHFGSCFTPLGDLIVEGSIYGQEQASPPSAPAANGFVLFSEDNGSGKTRLMVRFASGASQQIAIEP